MFSPDTMASSVHFWLLWCKESGTGPAPMCAQRPSPWSQCQLRAALHFCAFTAAGWPLPTGALPLPHSAIVNAERMVVDNVEGLQ